MKTSTVAFIALALAAPCAAAAQDNAAMATKAEIIETCTGAAELAAKVMEARLAGIPMATMMAAEVGETIRPMYDIAVMEAYRSPAYNTHEYQAQAITEFASRWMRECLDGMGYMGAE